MKKLSLGILAHVDAGKTTLSEALLYRCGALRKLGRVDHQNAFLDTDHIERERGITIFSKQAILPMGQLEVTLLDTPGHADFSSEMERTLQVMDYAILVISGSDGVQDHTQTLWRLLNRYQVPTFLFINKMDLAGADQAAVLAQLKNQLSDSCVDFSATGDAFSEAVAMCGETALNQYLERGEVEEEEIASLISRRQLFPCYFGAALKVEGVDALMAGLQRYTRLPVYPPQFAARVFKIARDPQGNRLTYLKVTGGCLRVKSVLSGHSMGSADPIEEKVDQIRIYSGAKFTAVEEAPAGTVCAVTGLSFTRPGDGLGAEPPSMAPTLSAVLTYRLLLPDGCDPYSAWTKLSQLEEEDPQLQIVWNERLREIHIQLMGEIQTEILQRMIKERFDLDVAFGPGSIVYRETIAAPVEGVGHFEPLRHYAEVQLRLEPLPRGSGLQFASACGEDVLDRNWQRLILTHLQEKVHIGVLTGSPITDMKITLTAGRAHVKHTEGGDFRQATYRAVRQGLMQAQSILLEPWYNFRLELPAQYVGRALSDLQRMSAETAPPETAGQSALLTGSAPVSELQSYAAQVTAYTRGLGHLVCLPGEYRPCHNQEEVVASIGYDCLRDTDNPADSIFCSHGAGVVVPWDQAPGKMHLPSTLRPRQESAPLQRPGVRTAYTGSASQDKELSEIFERTYGPIRRKDPFRKPPAAEQAAPEKRSIRPQKTGPEYLLVDGYNIIFAWEELKAVAQENLDAARKLLMDLLSNYQGFKSCQVILVFDAYKVPNNPGSVTRYHNIHVVYTKEAETADAYIERATYEIGREHRVRVATSDGPEQLIILGHGALRVSAEAFHAEVEQVEGQIAALLERNNRRENSQAFRSAMERAEKNR